MLMIHQQQDKAFSFDRLCWFGNVVKWTREKQNNKVILKKKSKVNMQNDEVN